MLGSRCPVVRAVYDSPHVRSQPSLRHVSATVPGARQSEAVGKAGNGIILLKPRVAINTYKMHQTLFNIAKDEVMASSVLQ